MLLARSATWCSSDGTVLTRDEQVLYAALLERVRAVLDDATLEAAWQEGGALDEQGVERHLGEAHAVTLPGTPQVAASVLDSAPDRTAAPPPPAGPDPEETGGLSARELGVLRLLFEGQQNKQIARALSISENTVRNHVRSIFQKLDAHTRTEAISTALRLGLVRVGEGQNR